MTRFPPLKDADEFTASLASAVVRFQEHGLDEPQAAATFAPPSEPLHVVAGPGSGKTTVLVLRILYLVFVHGYRPAEIIATTFTRKAASEMRSRVLGWGYVLRNHLIEASDSEEVRGWLRTHCEFSDIRLGTFDSLVQEFIAEHGPREEDPPVVIEPITATSIMLLDGLISNNGLHNSATLRQHLTDIGYWPINAPRLAGYLRQLSDRLANDLVDKDALAASSPAMQRACAAIDAFRESLARRQLIDYSGLSERFLTLVIDGALDDGLQQYRVMVVDEFQDTNCLQEACYFEMYSRFLGDDQCPASLTVVGDDDQSIFRFRGATVEIFTDFPNRIATHTGGPVCDTTFLSSNFRSRPGILSHFDRLVDQPDFADARVADKPSLVARTHGGAPTLQGLPVLGMFDDNRGTLANRLRDMLIAVFRGDGFRVQCVDAEFVIQGTEDHDFADAVLLGSSMVERKPERKDPLNLTGHLRAALEPDVPVFNPRGRALHDVLDVQRLLGLFLQCTDPNRAIQTSIPWLQAQFGDTMDGWRQRAQDLAASNPAPGNLAQFLNDWSTRTWRNRRRTLRDWPAIELLFTLTTWLPRFVEDPEYQVYLEAIARAVEQSTPLSAFGGRIVFDDRFDGPSVKHLLINVLAPIAGGEIDVDEELIPHVPRHWFPMMTIHQAKGLEFPLVIVDVGSGNGHEIRDFMRFPTRPSAVHHDEDIVAPHSALGNLRQARDSITRARDDLKRKYFVAMSRAQSVLILVGHTRFIDGNPLPSIQVGSRYDETRIWRYIPAAQCSTVDTDTVALI
ncbi:MAG: UvrD-helicase domain-containing protein [Phycisphaerales bacterium]